MIKKIFNFIVLILITSGCSTLDVMVDYDDQYNFNNAKTVAVVHENKPHENTLVNDRIINALNTTLEAKNYQKASQKDADLIFVFNTNVKDKTQIYTDDFSMGIRYRYGGMMATTSTYEYTEGTIIIDALNPKTKKIVWRGVGTKELKEKGTPQEKTKSINNVINKIMDKFPKREDSK